MAVHRSSATGQTSKDSSTGASFLSLSDPQYVTRFSRRHLNHKKARRNKLRKSANDSLVRTRQHQDQFLRPYSDPSAQQRTARPASGITGKTDINGAQASERKLKLRPDSISVVDCTPPDEANQGQRLPSIILSSPSFRHQGYHIVNGAPSILSSSPDSSVEKSASRSSAGQELPVGKLAPQLYVPYTRQSSNSIFFDLVPGVGRSVIEVDGSPHLVVSAVANESAHMYLHGNNSTASSFQPRLDTSSKHRRVARKLDHSVLTPDNSRSTADSSFTTEFGVSHQFTLAAPQLPFIALGPRFSPYEEQAEVSHKLPTQHPTKAMSPAPLSKQRFSSPASYPHSQAVRNNELWATAAGELDSAGLRHALPNNNSSYELRNSELMHNAANVAQIKRVRKRSASKQETHATRPHNGTKNDSSGLHDLHDKKLDIITAGGALPSAAIPRADWRHRAMLGQSVVQPTLPPAQRASKVPIAVATSVSKKPLPKPPGPALHTAVQLGSTASACLDGRSPHLRIGDTDTRTASLDLYHGLFRADVPTSVPSELFSHLLQPPHISASSTSMATYETQLRKEIKEREQLLHALVSEPNLPMAFTPPSTNSAHRFGIPSVKYDKQKPSALKRCGMALKARLKTALC